MARACNKDQFCCMPGPLIIRQLINFSLFEAFAIRDLQPLFEACSLECLFRCLWQPFIFITYGDRLLLNDLLSTDMYAVAHFHMIGAIGQSLQ